MIDESASDPTEIQHPAAERQSEEAQSAIEAIYAARERDGRRLGMLGICLLLGIGFYSFCSLESLMRLDTAEMSAAVTIALENEVTQASEQRVVAALADRQERVVYAKAAAHVLITLGLVWFCYQLLRAAERLRMPGFVTDVERIRALLGMKSPADAAAKHLESALRTQSDTLDRAFRLMAQVIRPDPTGPIEATNTVAAAAESLVDPTKTKPLT